MFFKEMRPKNSKSISSGGKLNGNDLTIEKNAKNPIFEEFRSLSGYLMSIIGRKQYNVVKNDKNLSHDLNDADILSINPLRRG